MIRLALSLNLRQGGASSDNRDLIVTETGSKLILKGGKLQNVGSRRLCYERNSKDLRESKGEAGWMEEGFRPGEC